MSESETAEGEYECASCGDILNIIGLVDHDCNTVLQASSLSKSERSTLMFVEARVVDHHGVLDREKMNYEDHQNLKPFLAAGLVVTAEAGVVESNPVVTEFTDEAWDLARDCRQARAKERAERADHIIHLGEGP